MSRAIALIYGLIAYVVFFVTFLYAIGFVGNLMVPRTIDMGPAAPLTTALIIDVILLGIFAAQHSLMARPFFKRAWTRIVPESVERSTYVLFSSLALILLYWQWRPIVAPVWTVANPTGVIALQVVFWIGWVTVLLSTFMISHFELFGLTQVWLNLKDEKPQPQFKTPFLYGFVRHPIYLGFVLAFWATPIMTMGHLLFAVMTTVYILVAIQLEEYDLIGVFGDQYAVYRRRVSMLIPLPRRSPMKETPP
jgi:methanethiol S-methyltransferase